MRRDVVAVCVADKNMSGARPLRVKPQAQPGQFNAPEVVMWSKCGHAGKMRPELDKSIHSRAAGATRLIGRVLEDLQWIFWACSANWIHARD